jgi:alanine-glyoxylate transaminase/serine-glyoxylate transaminase/serine-pyruvate transaminase
MGHASSKKNVILCLTALDSVLTRMGAPIHSGAGAQAAVAYYN